MQKHLKRTPRACERCRLARRRCEPPYPCRQCTQLGVSCDVRNKARPQRHRQRQPLHDQSLPLPSDHGHGGQPNGGDAAPSPNRAVIPPKGQRRLCSDTYAFVKGLIQDLMRQRYGYEFECALAEPHSGRPAPAGDINSALEGGVLAQPQLPLTPPEIRALLQSSAKFLGWQSPQLVDVEELHTASCEYLTSLVDLSPRGIAVLLTRARLPVDTIAVVFASLALGAVAMGESDYSRFYLGVSTEMVKYFVGQPTLNLCLSYFLQHLLALRYGTSNYAQGIISQAIHVARVLELHSNSHGNRGLLLFMVIYMADQLSALPVEQAWTDGISRYGSLQHNTEPLIQASHLEEKLFAPLIDAEPDLQALVDLITINGHVIEHSYKSVDLRDDEVQKLEAKIGYLCWQRNAPLQPGSGSYRSNYDLVAHIHMLCCRIKLRIPGLETQSVWLLSLSTCIHAAEGVLTAYFQLYQPVLTVLAREFGVQDLQSHKASTPIVAALAVTWRQVNRIMSSAFLVIFAYWRGELLHDEASRYMAMTRLLLEYPRWRWGGALNEAIETLFDISSFANFSVHQHMRLLLPGQEDGFYESLCERSPVAELDGLGAFPYGNSGNGAIGGALWPMMDAFPWSNDFASFAIDDQSLLGLADNMGFDFDSQQQPSSI